LKNLLRILSKLIETSSGDRRSEDFKISPQVDFEKPKSEVIKESGLTQRQADKAAEKLVENSPQVPRTANQGLENSPKVEKKNRQSITAISMEVQFWRNLQKSKSQASGENFGRGMTEKGLMNSSKPIKPIDTRKEVAKEKGLGEFSQS